LAPVIDRAPLWERSALVDEDEQMSTETPTQYETERPLALVTLPKESSRAHLTERFVREYEMRPEHAAAIGRALVDPTAVRRQLDSPLIKRFPGGVAKFIIADVFTPMISVNQDPDGGGGRHQHRSHPHW
jgi:hypothetical protein